MASPRRRDSAGKSWVKIAAGKYRCRSIWRRLAFSVGDTDGRRRKGKKDPINGKDAVSTADFGADCAITRRSILKVSMLGETAMLMPASNIISAASGARHPNVLMIIADDMNDYALAKNAEKGAFRSSAMWNRQNSAVFRWVVMGVFHVWRL